MSPVLQCFNLDSISLMFTHCKTFVSMRTILRFQKEAKIKQNYGSSYIGHKVFLVKIQVCGFEFA